MHEFRIVTYNIPQRVQPQDAEMHQLNYHDLGQSKVGECSHCPSRSLPDYSYFPLDLPYILSYYRGVDCDTGQDIFQLFKFHVHQSNLHNKSCPSVHSDDLF
jgi:hypothetical protein